MIFGLFHFPGRGVLAVTGGYQLALGLQIENGQIGEQQGNGCGYHLDMGNHKCHHDPACLEQKPTVVTALDERFHLFLFFNVHGLLNGQTHDSEVQYCHSRAAQNAEEHGVVEKARERAGAASQPT